MNKFNALLDRVSPHSTTILRVGLAIVFLYFGFTSVTAPESWIDLVPAWTNQFADAQRLVMIHGTIELVLGLLLLLGIKTRYVAFVLFLDLVHVLTLLNFGAIWVRDFGLCIATLSLALRKPKQNY